MSPNKIICNLTQIYVWPINCLDCLWYLAYLSETL